jgi:small subunit ribosomal protein S9
MVKKTTEKTEEKDVKAATEKPKAVRKPAVKKTVAAKAVEAVATEAKTETVTHAKHVTGGVEKYHKALGRRKEATARVRLIPGGSGNIIVNGKKIEDFFTVEWHRLQIMQPLVAVGANVDYDVSAKIEGGGVAGQAIALRHGIARCLLLVNEDFRKTLRRAGYLTRDPRAKERKKPGLKRARKRGQWAKR